MLFESTEILLEDDEMLVLCVFVGVSVALGRAWEGSRSQKAAWKICPVILYLCVFVCIMCQCIKRHQSKTEVKNASTMRNHSL